MTNFVDRDIHMANQHDSRDKLSWVTLYQERFASYSLVVLTVIGFLLVTSYLLGGSVVNSRPVALSYFVESVGNELKPEQALAELRQGKFTKVDREAGQLDLGYMREGVWVLMQFENPPQSSSEDFVLQLRHTYINGSFTPLQIVDAQRGVSTARIDSTTAFTDKLLPRTQNLADIRHVSFQFRVKAGETYHALIRLRAHVMNVPFLLLENKIFLSSVIRELIPLGAIFGGLVLLAVYNMMVGFARRELEFVFYGCYVCAIALLSVSINGLGHMFIWPDKLWIHYNSANMLINLLSLSYLGFFYYLFHRTPLVGLERVAWIGLLGLGTAGLVLQVFEGGFFASIEAVIMSLGSLVLSLVRGWRARKEYGRIANLFLISESVLFLGAATYCAKMAGWLPSTNFTLNILLLCTTLEAILLSFVLSEKMALTIDEREYALKQLEVAHAELVSSVRDRTLALAARYTSHEVLNPVFAIRLKSERIRDEIHNELSSQNPSLSRLSEQVLTRVNEMFRLIDSIIHTIRAIKSLSSDGLREEVVPVDVALALDDALKMLEVKSKQVIFELRNELPSSICVLARRSDVVQIFTNLLSNSFDAISTQEKPWIRISAEFIKKGESRSSAFVISVVDSGEGPSDQIRSKLFKSEVSSKGPELGMGLGLSFCKRLAERNGGMIAFDSGSGHTRFYFTLPSAFSNGEYQQGEFEYQKAG